jgi:hypothetical protein
MTFGRAKKLEREIVVEMSEACGVGNRFRMGLEIVAEKL